MRSTEGSRRCSQTLHPLTHRCCESVAVRGQQAPSLDKAPTATLVWGTPPRTKESTPTQLRRIDTMFGFLIGLVSSDSRLVALGPVMWLVATE
jgi:hypothetical protein